MILFETKIVKILLQQNSLSICLPFENAFLIFTQSIKIFNTFVFMKWFSFILAIYIFSLCYYPCKDNGNHQEYAAKSYSTSKSCNEHHDEHNCCHKCSPFCFCNCCHMNTVVSLTFEFQELSIIPVELFTSHIENYVPEIYLKIWQPPKI